MARRLAGVLAGCALAVVGVLLSAAPAAAHAALIGSNPPDGAVLAAPPSAVTLRFSESVQVPSGGLSVVGPDGRPVAGVIVSQNGPAVSARLPALQGVRGTYTVSWRVISADTHPVGGAVSFSVGAVSRTGHAPTPHASRAVGVVFGVARFGGFVGVTVLVGAVALCCYGGTGVVANRRVRRLVVTAWSALVVATFAALALQGPYVSASGLGHLTDGTLLAQTRHSRYGSMLSLRIALLGALPGTLILAERRRTRWPAVVACGLLAAGLVATWAMLGHASQAGSQSPLTVAADAVHLLAAALWLGGLAAILAMLWRQETSGAVVTAVQRFSPFAAGCVTVLAATGLYQAYLRVETPAAILTTGYGRLLVVKVALVAAVLAVASRTRAHLRRGPTIALRRLVAAETGGALVVLALTAALVESQPAIQQYAARPATRTVRFVAGEPGNLTLRLPNTARGLGTGDLTVRSADGHPRDVPELRATWAQPAQGIGPLSARLTRTGTGRYKATWAPLSVDGSWQLAVTIRTTDIDETTVRIPVRIR